MATSMRDVELAAAGDVHFSQIDLAHEHSFRLGAVLVEPSRLRLSRDGVTDITVEPRVMQVLSALFEAHGNVVGRDDLIERCWAGRIVGENSINRVISILRRTSERIGKDSFEIETIPKVGYRLNCVSMEPTDDVAPDGVSAERAEGGLKMTRRRVIACGAAAAAGGLVVGGASTISPEAVAPLRNGWAALLGRHVPKPEARQLYDAGMQAQYFGLTGTSEQAELYFRRAAQADPQWADAWGALAMSNFHLISGDNGDRQWRFVEQTRAAANRALELDPDNQDAIVALSLIQSPLGRWLEAVRDYEALLGQFPESFVLRDHLARVLSSLGRFDEAAKHSAIYVARHPLMPMLSTHHHTALWGAGRLQEAEAENERAYRLFAKCHLVWYMRCEFLTYNGRASEALGFAIDRDAWPYDMPDFLFERRILAARAVLTRSRKDIDAVLRAIDVYIKRCLSWHPFTVGPAWAVPFLSHFGEIDKAFDILDSYLLWRGPLAPPQSAAKGPLARRDTSFLFMPTLENVRADKRFAGLVEEVGLTAQFRASRKWPDSWRLAS